MENLANKWHFAYRYISSGGCFFLSSLVCKINSRQHKIQENSEFEFIPSSANKHCKRETWKGKNTIANDSHHTKKSFILIEQVLNMDSLPRSISFYCLVRVQEDLELTPPRAKDKKKSKLDCRTIPDPNRSLHIDRASFNNEFNRRKFHHLEKLRTSQNQRTDDSGLEGRGMC